MAETTDTKPAPATSPEAKTAPAQLGRNASPAGSRSPRAGAALDDTGPGGLTDGPEPTADVVAIVSRDVNGDPMQSVNYEVLVPEDADEDARAAHHNLAGEAVGAKHVTPVADGDREREVDPGGRGDTAAARERETDPGVRGDAASQDSRVGR